MPLPDNSRQAFYAESHSSTFAPAFSKRRTNSSRFLLIWASSPGARTPRRRLLRTRSARVLQRGHRAHGPHLQAREPAAPPPAGRGGAPRRPQQSRCRPAKLLFPVDRKKKECRRGLTAVARKLVLRLFCMLHEDIDYTEFRRRGREARRARRAASPTAGGC